VNKFITFREKDSLGNLQYYVLQRAYPHYVGVVMEKPEKAVIEATPIMNYMLWMVFNGCIQGAVIPGYKNTIDEIASVMSDMAEWYYVNRIVPDEKRFKKWKINKDVSIKFK